MMTTATIALLWLGFAGSHMILSSLPVRRPLVEALGDNAFRGFYSVVSFLFFIPLVRVYFGHRHAGPALWTFAVGDGLRWVIYLGMGVAFVLLLSAFLQPNPASLAGGKPEPRGVLHITRHPLLMALGLFGLLHMIPNGFAGDVVFFGGFAAFAVVGGWHQDQRKLVTNPDYPAFHAATPFLPFTGHDTLRGLRELSPIAVVVGIGLTILVRSYHVAWFGG